MAEVTFCLVEVLFSFDHLRIINIATGRNTEALHIEVYVFHLLGGNIQLIIGESHHASLVDLYLSFANLFGITAVGNTHVTGKTEFYSKVGMLRFIAGQSQRSYSPFGDVVATSADSIFRIVAFRCKCFYFGRVQCHHLSHTYMAQGDADGTKQIFRFDFFGIPFGYGVSRFAEFVFLTVREGETFVGIFYR